MTNSELNKNTDPKKSFNSERITRAKVTKYKSFYSSPTEISSVQGYQHKLHISLENVKHVSDQIALIFKQDDFEVRIKQVK